MPKTKKGNDSDTSDSGPDDKAPVKKPRSEDKKSKPSNKDEEPTWILDKKRHLKIREFRGKWMVDIREYYEADGELKPGKKGISLSLPQWRKLVDSVDEIDDAIKERV